MDEIIRINDLPLESSPVSAEFIAIDGSSTRKATIQAIVDAGAPVASQAEAEAGVNAVKRMTPLTTSQAIDALAATVSQGALADSALQPSSIGSSVQGFSNDLTAIAGLTSAADKMIYATGAGAWALADLPSAGRTLIGAVDQSAQRTALGLGGAAVLGVGTSTGTVAAGDDSRIVGSVQKASNLSDIANASTARTNLGLGGSATLNVGTGSGTVAAGNDSRIVGAVQSTRTLTGGTGMAVIGDLSADRTVALSAGSIASLVLADSAVQRTGNETKTGDIRITDGMLKVYKNLQTIPTTADNFGMIVSQNRSNADGETNIRNMYVNGTGATKAFVLSQITTAGSAEVDLLTLYRNGRASVGSIGWLEAISSQAETVSMFTSLSKPGLALGVVGASRTSDANAPAYFSGIGVWGFSHNNRARTGDFNTTFMGWGGYFENRRDNGSGRSHGVEIGSVNLGAAGVDPEASLMTPYDYAQVNSINSLLLSAGRPDVGVGQHDISNAMNIIANGAKYRTGLVFGDGSVAVNGFTVPAILMPTLYSFQWFTSEGLRAYILADQSAGAVPVGMVMRNDRIEFDFNNAASLRMKASELRALSTNGGFDTNSVYFGATSANATQQWQFQTGGSLFVNRNTGTLASPVWTNMGQFNATTGAYTNVSDMTVKTDFRAFDRDIMETLDGLADAVCMYRMKGNKKNEFFGFKAQGVQLVLPEAVSSIEQPDGVYDARALLMLEDRPMIAALTLAVANINNRMKILENAA